MAWVKGRNEAYVAWRYWLPIWLMCASVPRNGRTSLAALFRLAARLCSCILSLLLGFLVSSRELENLEYLRSKKDTELRVLAGK